MYFPQSNYQLTKVFLKNEPEIKMFSDKRNPREFVTIIYILQEMIMEILSFNQKVQLYYFIYLNFF